MMHSPTTATRAHLQFTPLVVYLMLVPNRNVTRSVVLGTFIKMMHFLCIIFLKLTEWLTTFYFRKATVRKVALPVTMEMEKPSQ